MTLRNLVALLTGSFILSLKALDSSGGNGGRGGDSALRYGCLSNPKVKNF